MKVTQNLNKIGLIVLVEISFKTVTGEIDTKLFQLL